MEQWKIWNELTPPKCQDNKHAEIASKTYHLSTCKTLKCMPHHKKPTCTGCVLLMKVKWSNWGFIGVIYRGFVPSHTFSGDLQRQLLNQQG